MKKFTFFFLAVVAMMVAMPVFAQDRNNEDEVVKVDSRRRDYREGEILVKFKPTSRVNVRAKNGRFQTSAVSAVDAALEALGVDTVDQLMPLTGRKVSQRRMRAANGAEVVDTDMSKLYRIKFNREKIQSVHEAIETLKALPEVEYAEPNYVVYALQTETNAADIYAQEPLYKQQHGVSALNLHYLWNKPKVTTKRSVIAILDTGVDTEHPDLQANIWTNEAEANGAEEQDDDGNGFADDVHGWDFVNQTANVRDFNGHGTHCAGIAAAVGNNGIGIAGANPDALIMPIAVMQSDGTGDVATIIKGIDYATANGADVLSMSFGGYQHSIAEEQALVKAYAKMVLVAAAGNDGHDMDGHHCMGDAPMFPAAFTFVLGVEAGNAQGNLAGFSNYDCNGPLFSSFGEEQLYNYELRAPGVGIMSTYPKGQYKSLNGTSMACPLVAGAISALLERKEYLSKEILFGDLIYTRKQNGYANVDFKEAYNITDEDRKPELSLVSYAMVDSVGGDGDGRPDSGDTISFYPVLKNMWGQAENIKMTLELGELEDPEIVTILDSEVEFGRPLSSYAKNRSVNPIRFVVNPNCVDGRHIKLLFTATCDNAQYTLEHNFVIIAENGVEIGGMITEDLTLYPNVHYIVTSPLAVPDGVTLTLKPGAVLKFKDGTGLSIADGGHIIAKGKLDSIILFTSSNLNEAIVSSFVFREDTLTYCKFINLAFKKSNILYGGSFNYCFFENNRTVLSQEEFFNLYYEYKKIPTIENTVFVNNIVTDNFISFSNLPNKEDTIILKSNFINNEFPTSYRIMSCGSPGTFYVCNNNILGHSNIGYTNQYGIFLENNIFGNDVNYKVEFSSPIIIDYSQYWGSNREDIIREGIWDINTNHGYGYYDLSKRLTCPSSEAHGIVWKVVVNGYDAQDEFELLPPLGVGRHKFEVYFNRPMDVSVAPSISMGVRPPYTQVSIAEDGSWSADSTIYTAYLDITGKTATDGLNRIYVYGAEDTDHFEIPEENMRFNVQVASAGSMSTGLMAEAGLGKVKLTWETDEEDFEDLLGYNIYRWTEDTIKWNRYYDSNCKCYIEAGWKFDTLIINNSLIDSKETEFIDYDVEPGKTYYYFIKQMTTSLSSYDLSNPVAATPLTASKGDANGSMTVDVADVVTQVAWLTNQNPQPFIFEAADVNVDGVVNILDVVATISIILNPSSAGIMSVDNTATYYIENGILYVETTVALGGVQFSFVADKDAEIKPLAALDGFEKVTNWINDYELMFMAYSMSGKTIPAGRHALLEIGDAELSSIVLSDTQGRNVLPIDGTTTNLGVVEQMQMSAPYPNPFRQQVIVPYLIGQSGEHAVRMVFTDVAGRTIDVYTTANDFGSYSYTWTPAEGMQPGVYFVSLYVDDKLMQTSKIVYIQ